MKIIKKSLNSITVVHKEPIKFYIDKSGFYIFDSQKPIKYGIHRCPLTNHFYAKFTVSNKPLPNYISCRCGEKIICTGNVIFPKISLLSSLKEKYIHKYIALYWGSKFNITALNDIYLLNNFYKVSYNTTLFFEEKNENYRRN